MRFGVYSSLDCNKHEGFSKLEEKPVRLSTLRDLFHELDLEILTAHPATSQTLRLAHSRKYVSQIFSLSKQRQMGQWGDALANLRSPYIQYYLRIMSGSYAAAAAAAGCVNEAVQTVINNKMDRAFCVVRPPGHHAGPKRGEGFCIFNNVAIGALSAVEAGKRVAIVDFDRHHGNGTQQIVEERGQDQILFVSSFLEGCKYAEGLKNKPPSKNIIAIPIAPGSTLHHVKSLYEALAIPAIIKFKPDLVMISAGFDMHKDDPCNKPHLFGKLFFPWKKNIGIQLQSEDFASLTSTLVKAANETCGGKIVSVLEGGYECQALKESVRHHLYALRR